MSTTIFIKIIIIQCCITWKTSMHFLHRRNPERNVKITSKRSKAVLLSFTYFIILSVFRLWIAENNRCFEILHVFFSRLLIKIGLPLYFFRPCSERRQCVTHWSMEPTWERTAIVDWNTISEYLISQPQCALLSFTNCPVLGMYITGKTSCGATNIYREYFIMANFTGKSNRWFEG